MTQEGLLLKQEAQTNASDDKALHLTKKQKSLIQAAVDIQTLSAVEADELGFGAKCLVATCLPYRNPKPEQLINGCWTRTNGHYSLWVQGGIDGIPYGSYPRLFAIWLTTEATRTRSRQIELGSSFRAFCRQLEIDTSTGKRGAGKLLMEQIDKFLGARIGFINKREGYVSKKQMEFSEEYHLFWDVEGEDKQFRDAAIVLSERFFTEITTHHIPVDMRAVVQIKQSAQALDIYQWLAYRIHNLNISSKKSARPTWEQLNQQFGGNYASLRHFKEEFIAKLRVVKTVYPEAKVIPQDEGLLLLASPTPVRALKVIK